jgi:hypothetical protein
MEKDWVNVFSTTLEHISEIAKDVLDDNNIECILINKKDSMYHFGEIEVYVKHNNAVKAKYLLKDL